MDQGISRCVGLTTLIICISLSWLRAQDVFDESVGSDPAVMQTRFTTDMEAYYFLAGARYYGLRFGYDYALVNKKHLFGMAVPFVHTIFPADFGGFENTSGIGDIKMRYMFVPYLDTRAAGLQRVSGYLEVSAPTGEYQLGRGTGSWMVKPGFIFTFKPNPYVAFYPEVKMQLSTSEATRTGGDAPDPNEPERNDKIRDLTFSLPATVLVNDWKGWVSMNAIYTMSFSEEVDFLFLRVDFGKMIGNKTSAALNISKFIAGEPRLDVLVQVRLQFFIRS